MPFPPSTWIDIDTIPYSQVITQSEFNSSLGVEMWWKFTSTKSQVFGFHCEGSEEVFYPNFHLLDEDGNGVEEGGSSPCSALLTAGVYWLWLRNTQTDPPGPGTDIDFLVRADTRLLDEYTVETDDFYISDDYDNPGMLFNSSGVLKSYVSSTQSAKFAARLPAVNSGVSIWNRRFGPTPKYQRLLNENLEIITDVTGPTDTVSPRFTIDKLNMRFYFSSQLVGGLYKLWYISITGEITDIGYIFPEGYALRGMAINNDATKLYWASQLLSGKHVPTIRTLNLDDFTNGPDLYTIPGFVITGVGDYILPSHGQSTLLSEMFVLPNGNIVFVWSQNYEDPPLTHITLISSIGVLINDTIITYPWFVMHIAHMGEDSDHILYYIGRDDDGSAEDNLAETGRLNLLTGVKDRQAFHQQFSIFQNFSADEGRTSHLFGPAYGGVLIHMDVSSSSSPIGGIYFINTAKTHDIYYDTEKKIPNPIVRTGGIGE